MNRRAGPLAWACLAAILAACGGRDAPAPRGPGAVAAPADAVAPGLAAAPTPDRLAGIDLPRSGTIGAFPSTCVLVTIAADGRMKADGAACDFAGLTAVLARRAAGPEAREPDGSSRVDLGLAVDRATPWRLVQWAMQAAADPAAKAYRIHFVVRPESGEAPGALAAFLPRDRCCAPSGDVDREPPPALALRLREGGSLDEGAVYAALRAAPQASRTGRPVLDAEETVPCGVVLRVVDLVFRAGFRGVAFQGAPSPAAAGDVAAVVARARAETRTTYVRVGRMEIAPDAPRAILPSGTVVAGRPAGDWWEPRGSGAALAGEAEEPEPSEEAHPPEEPAPVGASAAASESRPGRTLDPVEGALEWLHAHRTLEGGWSAAAFASWCDGKPNEGEAVGGAGAPERDVGVTGLALGAFLAAGWTNRSEGPFGRTVGLAHRHLRAAQAADGGIGARAHGRWLEDHAVATLALLRLYAETRSSIFREPTAAAVRFLLASRDRDGAWGASGSSGASDVVTSAWAALCVREAFDLAAADVGARREPFVDADPRVLADLLLWVNARTEIASGRFLEEDRHSTLSVSTATAAALVIRAAAGDPSDGWAYRQGIDFLLSHPPAAGADLDPVGWFLGSVAVWNARNPAWKSWEPRLQAAWIDTQRKDGAWCEARGSWDPGRASAGLGRLGVTALGSMSMALYYRYHHPPGSHLRDR